MNSPNFDYDLVRQSADNHKGFVEETTLPIGGWVLDSGAPIPATGSGAVGYGDIATGWTGYIWKATAATTDIIKFDIGTCGWWKPVGYGMPAEHLNGLQLVVLARRKDTTGSATEDTTLGLTADVGWFTPALVAKGPYPSRSADAAWNTLTTKASAVPAAKTTSLGDFATYTLDIGARLIAESKSIKTQSPAWVKLSVTSTVGTALAIEVGEIRLRYARHGSLFNKNERDPAYTLNPS